MGYDLHKAASNPTLIPSLTLTLIPSLSLCLSLSLSNINRSAKYEIQPEIPLEGTRLFHASHRKCTDAYAISLRGCKKLADSGFRECIHSIDDFMPAVFAGHPRLDIDRLECVQTARAEGFACFTFSDDAMLSRIHEWPISDLNHSALLGGDFGVIDE